MPIDSSIALGVKPLQIDSPVNQMAQVLQMQGAQQANQLNAMKMQQAQTAQDRQNKLYSLMGGMGADTTDEQRSTTLKGGGFFDEADKLDKNSIERNKAKSEGQFKMSEALSKFGGVQKDLSTRVFANPTLENATAALTQAAQYHKMLGFGDMDISGELQALQGMQSPEQIKQWAAGHALNAEKLLPQNVNFASGDVHVNQSIDPITGQVTKTGSTAIGQSADNKATNLRTAQEGAANRGNSMAIANMTDARARELNAINKEAAGNKPLNDSQSKAALFGARMQDAHETMDELAKAGTTTSNPGSTAGWGVGPIVTAMSSSDKQRLDQAKRDFINADLRRESGASISPSEFDNAEKQYFPQIGDKPEVIAQKERNRATASRGVLAEIPEGQRDKVVSEIRGKSTVVGLKPGTVQEGHRYKGGNPADPKSWEKV